MCPGSIRCLARPTKHGVRAKLRDCSVWFSRSERCTRTPQSFSGEVLVPCLHKRYELFSRASSDTCPGGLPSPSPIAYQHHNARVISTAKTTDPSAPVHQLRQYALDLLRHEPNGSHSHARVVSPSPLFPVERDLRWRRGGCRFYVRYGNTLGRHGS